MLSVQLLRHQPEVPAAPYRYSTAVSKSRPEKGVLSAACQKLGLPDSTETWDYWLDFCVGGSTPEEILGYAEKRYENCARCHLSSSRTRIAFFRGNPAARVLVVGESPGRTEDSVGRPFVGASGRLQDQLFREVGIDPDRDIAWTNLCACRCCNNRSSDDRSPSVVEKLACSERLFLTLCAVRPRVVLCFGKHATSLFWNESPRNNVWVKLTPSGGGESVTVGVMRHPAYILRGMMTNYKEYFTAKLMLKKLALHLPSLRKVAVWPFLPLYTTEALTRETVLIGRQDATCV